MASGPGACQVRGVDADATTGRTRSAIDVFRYLDYRAFLADYYKQKKRRGFSYRAFSRSAGLGAPNYHKLVIAGARNLTPAMAARFAAACGLSGESADYFAQLVAFNQARGIDARNKSYERLSAFRRYRQAQKLEVAQAAYHSTWYLPAIRELVASPGFREDPAWLASALIPAIKPAEAKHALELLIELGLLERDARGRLRQCAKVVSTGPETRSMNIGNYHAEMMRRATAAIELVPAPERDISSLTMCLDDAGLSRIKQRIQEFRRELIELADAVARPSRVVQLNFQLFPLSKPAAPARRKGSRSPREDRNG
jgi:uncharacterized protein (TIGR02147 family)